jgi:hypothetical protein
VKFEPTPRSGAGFPDYARRTDVNYSTDDPSSSGPSGGASEQSVRDTQSDHEQQAAAGSNGGDGAAPLAPSRNWLILPAALALLLLPAGLRLAVRRARMTRPLEPPEAAESAWLEVRDRVRDLRLPWTGSMTPRAREHALAPLLHGDAAGLQALHRLAMSVERARYAVSLTPATSPAADAREVMAVVGRQTSRRSRIKAFLWPTSLMPDAKRGWRRLTQRAARRRIA